MKSGALRARRNDSGHSDLVAGRYGAAIHRGESIARAMVPSDGRAITGWQSFSTCMRAAIDGLGLTFSFEETSRRISRTGLSCVVAKIRVHVRRLLPVLASRRQQAAALSALIDTRRM